MINPRTHSAKGVNKTQYINIMQIDLFDLKKHWANRLARLQRINQNNERLNIGGNHSDIRFKLTQLVIKFKI